MTIMVMMVMHTRLTVMDDSATHDDDDDEVRAMHIAYGDDGGDDSDAHDDDDDEVRAAAANSPSRASPPALSLANVTKVLRIIISMIVGRWF